MFALDHGGGMDVISYNRNIFFLLLFFSKNNKQKKEKTFMVTFKKAIAVGC